MFKHPLSLQGVYSSILFVNLHRKMQKSSNCVSTGKKIAQQAQIASLKNSTDVSAPFARFPNYGQSIHWGGYFLHLDEAFFHSLLVYFSFGNFIPFPFPNFRRGMINYYMNIPYAHLSGAFFVCIWARRSLLEIRLSFSFTSCSSSIGNCPHTDTLSLAHKGWSFK